MASVSLLDALDMHNTNTSNNTKKQLGENNNAEYEWSNNHRETIVQYYSQLNETASNNEFTMEKLRKIYRGLITESLPNPTPKLSTSGGMGVTTPNLSTSGGMGVTTPNTIPTPLIIYKLIANTRDIIAGKAIYGLTYMMISEWALHANYLTYTDPKCAHFCNTLATQALQCLVLSKTGEHPLGSWKDIKYFCNYWKQVSPYTLAEEDPMLQKALALVCNQLRQDAETSVTSQRSLVAKWIPREKSNKFGWLTKMLAYRYFNEYLITTPIYKSRDIGVLSSNKKKCLTEFRKLVASINKSLDTTQIKQCQNEWAKIDFDKGVTSITMRKQSYAFQNKTKKNKERYHNIEEKEIDRNQCANHYKAYVSRCAENPKNAKGKNVSMVDFVRSALEISNYSNEIEKMIINSQWINSSQNTNTLENMIAMVDTSGSMESDNCKPLYSAIGLGLRVAEKSTFGKRIMTFSATPEWVNLDDCDNFVDSVKKVRNAPWGMNTNFRAALDLILDAAIASNITPEQMEDLTLAIFSDMQIDQAMRPPTYRYLYTDEHPDNNKENTDLDTMFEMMRKKYSLAGQKSKFSTPYPMPHILFWNLRTTDGFPNLSSTQNTSMLSGSSPNSLNLFANKGINGLREITPWSMMMESLSNSRYDEFNDIIKNASIEYAYT